MEEDLLNEKTFDMIIQIKGLSLLLPEYGIYKQFDYFKKILFILFLFYRKMLKIENIFLNINK